MQGHPLDVVGIEAHEAVELGAIGEGGERISEAIGGVTVEVPLAGESRPAGEDSQGDDLARTERGLRSWPPFFSQARLAEVVDRNVECGEEGVHVEHEESAPFLSGSGSKPTLERGHLPLKPSTGNSHQAFKRGVPVKKTHDYTHNYRGYWSDGGSAG